MNSPIDRINRTLLVLAGLLLTAAGVAVLAQGLGFFGTRNAHKPVLPGTWSTFIRDNPWYWWAVAALCVVVALLMLRWLIAQLHTNRLNHLNVEPDNRDGETILHAGAIADAVEHEAQGYPGVNTATMRLRGTPSSHRHQLTVVLDARADLDALRTRLNHRTIPNFRQAMDFEHPTLDIRLVLAPRKRRPIN